MKSGSLEKITPRRRDSWSRQEPLLLALCGEKSLAKIFMIGSEFCVIPIPNY
jgi:hypothetical protein